MTWARLNEHIVFTHDLDFGTLLALTRSRGPSVLQVRSQNVSTEAISDIVIAALLECEDCLQSGALVVVEQEALRIRMLPIR